MAFSVKQIIAFFGLKFFILFDVVDRFFFCRHDVFLATRGTIVQKNLFGGLSLWGSFV